MKNQVSLFLVLCFFMAIGYSQEVPKIFPVSPEASSLGKYGDIPINLSTGKINYTIPIYTIKESGFQLPIAISYNYSGLLIDEIPGITGLGWSLNAGGLITRQVRGRPDEDTNGYIGDRETGKNYVIPYLFNPSSITPATRLLFYEEANIGEWDLEPDKFVLNVGGINATFYFNENKEIVLTPYRPIKIEALSSDLSLGFKVTDENGIQYYFKEKERSKRKNFNSIFDVVATPVNGYTSSWKISKIILTNGKEIQFQYKPFTYYQQFSYDSYRKYVRGSGNLPQCYDNLDFNQTQYQLDTKILEKITFPKGEIKFESSTIATSNTNADYNKYLARLNKITINDKNQKLIKNFNLSYDFPDKTRKLLNKVTINNDNNNSYEFSYYGSPSDNISFSKQDFWGYYNSNSTGRLINYNSLYESRIPNFAKARTGALQTIKYPTQGTSEIEYEANTYDPGPTGDYFDDFITSSGECATLTGSLSVGVGIHNGSPSNSASDVKRFTVTSNDFYIKLNLNVVKNTTIGSVYAGLRKIDSPAPSGIKGCESSTLQGCEPCSGAQEYYSGGFPQNTLEKSFSSPHQQRLLPGTYEIYATASGAFRPCDGSYPEFNGCESVSASASISFSEGATAIPRAREVGGIRVSQTKSCPDSNPNHCIIKKYEYENSEGISSGFLFRRVNLFTYPSYISQGGNVCAFTNYSSSSNAPLSTYFGSHIVYSKVKEYTIDHQGNKNGEKEIIFTKGGIPTSVDPFIALNNREWLNGKILKEIYKNQNNDTIKINSNKFLFSIPQTGSTKVSYGLKIRRAVTNLPVGSTGLVNNVPSDYVIGVATYDSRNDVDLIKSKTEEIIEGNNKLVSNTNYFYDNPTHLQLTRTETTTSDNKTVITKTSYPDDVTSTGSLGNDPLLTDEKWAIDKLKTQHRIAEPIQVETTVKNTGGVQLSKNVQRTNYKDWGNNLVLPQFVQTLKGNYSASNKLQDRLQYKSYYANGNSKELLKKGGSTITYIWGYQEQYPIAKIENASFSNIPTSLYNDILTRSDEDTDNCRLATCKEEKLRVALNKLRNASLAPNLSKAMITTYTYDPLIGVTSITDPGGNTSYYHYDAFNRLQYIKNKDGEVLKEYKYNYKVEEIVATTTSSATTVTSGQSVTLTTNASGGTGNFTYKWTVSNANLNQVFNTATGSLTITTTTNHAPNFTVTCEVKDTQTEEVMATTTQVNVTTNFPALVVGNITYTSGSNYVGKNVTHTIHVSGGSGNYKYNWRKSNSQTSINLGSYATSSTTSSKTARITPDDCTYYTIICTVKDLTTNTVAIKTARVFISSGCSSGGGGVFK
jgi:YD repeat-containing protein